MERSAKKFLVFDLNGVLMKRVKSREKKKIVELREADGVVPGCGDLIYMRPHLDKLIDLLHEKSIEYIFWTTAQEHNGVHLLKAVTSRGMNKHKGALFASCALPIPGHPFKMKKPLSVVAEKFDIPLESIRLIDDEAIKCSPPELHIEIEEYDPHNQEDTGLLHLIERLSKEIE